ncbi:MAG: hypothetical protein Q9194_004509 [Teloschistes cf. exilis]
MSKEEATTTTQAPAMDLQLSRVFSPEGATHVVKLTNEQDRDLIMRYMFISNRRCDFLGFAGRLQTYLDKLGQSTDEPRWKRLLKRLLKGGGEVAEGLKLFVANVGGIIHNSARSH